MFAILGNKSKNNTVKLIMTLIRRRTVSILYQYGFHGKKSEFAKYIFVIFKLAKFQ